MSPLEVLGADGGVVVRRDDLRDGKVTALSAPAVSLDNATRIGCFSFHGQLIFAQSFAVTTVFHTWASKHK